MHGIGGGTESAMSIGDSECDITLPSMALLAEIG